MREYRQGRAEIADVPTRICTVPQDTAQVLLRNVSDVTVYVGGPDVKIEGPLMGMPIYPDDAPIPLACYDSDAMELYGVAAPASDDNRSEDDGAAIVFILPS